MRKVLSAVRSAVDQYQMIAPDDRICVGVSGGKDSVLLLAALAGLRRFYPVPFTLHAVTLDPGFGGVQTDYSPIARLCEELHVPYTVVVTDLAKIIFEDRRESNPCSLCARMRRGKLHNAALNAGCNAVALGHHFDDAVETFFLNLLYGGRISCFSPKSYLDRKKLMLIRPLLFMSEREVENAVRRCGLPVVKSRCPADGNTARQELKEKIALWEQDFPGLRKRVFGAMQRDNISGFGVK